MILRTWRNGTADRTTSGTLRDSGSSIRCGMPATGNGAPTERLLIHMATKKAASNGRKKISVRGTRVPMFDKDFTIIRFGRIGKAPLRRLDEASVMVRKAGKALKKPGIKRKVVFKKATKGIFAYSVDPSDATRVVREASDGTRRIGRVIAGRFKSV